MYAYKKFHLTNSGGREYRTLRCSSEDRGLCSLYYVYIWDYILICSVDGMFDMECLIWNVWKRLDGMFVSAPC